jgi:hypothetical protein
MSVTSSFVLQEECGLHRDTVDVSRLYIEWRVMRVVAYAFKIRGNHRSPTSHGLCHRETKPLRARGVDQCERTGVQNRELLIGRIDTELNIGIGPKFIERLAYTPAGPARNP